MIYIYIYDIFVSMVDRLGQSNFSVFIYQRRAKR